MKQLILIPLLLIKSSSFSQQPIFATISGGDLYSFDLTNCTRHSIGSTGQGFGDIAFIPDGRLWGIIGGQLYQIDTATAIATLVGNTGVGSITLVGLNDSTLLAEFGMNLYGINTNNATSYYIDHIGYGASGDLTWYDDDLYMTTPVIKIVLNNTNTAILSVTNLNSSVPTCKGAVTASFVGDYNSIVGFNGPNLYKICQIDGSYEMLCPSLNIGGTPGAAYSFIHYTLSTPATVSIDLYDVFGNKLQQLANGNQQQGEHNTTLDARKLANGVYILKIRAGEQMAEQKVVVMN
ncbi:MAG TPA: T9SS type A sorting domain-containing protein [Chitinophagales bacterium]|nr:T9SS type A sorting domain-containing protein [Chitinophagales bacterium]